MPILFLLINLVSLLFPRSILANTPTPTKASSLDEIQKIRQAVQEKVKEKLKEISSPSSKKGIIGTVIQIDGNQITLDYQNQNRTVNIATDATLIDLKRNKTKLANLKVGQEILAMGINDNATNILEAKRIIFIELKTLEPKSLIISGKIVDISKSSPLIVVIPGQFKDRQYQIKTDAKTTFSTNTDKSLTFKNLESGHRLIAVISADPKIPQTYYATKIIDLDYQPSPTPTKKTAN